MPAGRPAERAGDHAIAAVELGARAGTTRDPTGNGKTAVHGG